MQPFSRIAGSMFFVIVTESMNPQRILYHAPDGQLYIHDGKVGGQLCFLALDEAKERHIRHINPEVLPIEFAPSHPESERPSVKLVEKHELAPEIARWLSLALTGARTKMQTR